MSDFLNIVFVDRPGGHRILCEAPAWPSLEKGDRVLHQTTDGIEAEGICATDAAFMGGRELAFVLEGFAPPLPLLRVVARVEVRRFEYEDEKTPEGADTPTDDIDG